MLLAASSLAVGCAIEPPDEGEEGEIRVEASALEIDNALNPNALNPNALNPNALNPNALSVNALNLNALSAEALRAILDPGEAGALSRQHLKYTVSCALSSTQSFTFTWVDDGGLSHVETYWGLLGVAPSWSSQPMALDAQQWVSACLASRTNYYGIQVTISSRGNSAALGTPGVTEVLLYPKEEGAFWGNIYGASPALYTCHRSANDLNSRLNLRDCSAGHVDLVSGAVEGCGMIQRLGSCDSYCDPLNSQGTYRPSCWDDPAQVTATRNLHAVTVFLP
jgi:hypothetical protein